MSHRTAKTVTNKFLNTTKSDREGGRTVNSDRVPTDERVYEKREFGEIFLYRPAGKIV